MELRAPAPPAPARQPYVVVERSLKHTTRTFSRGGGGGGGFGGGAAATPAQRVDSWAQSVARANAAQGAEAAALEQALADTAAEARRLTAQLETVRQAAVDAEADAALRRAHAQGREALAQASGTQLADVRHGLTSLQAGEAKLVERDAVHRRRFLDTSKQLCAELQQLRAENTDDALREACAALEARRAEAAKGIELAEVQADCNDTPEDVLIARVEEAEAKLAQAQTEIEDVVGMYQRERWAYNAREYLRHTSERMVTVEEHVTYRLSYSPPPEE